MTPYNMDYHEWEVTTQMVHDQKLIDHPTNGLQHECSTKLVMIVGPPEEGSWKEVMFTQVRLVAESARHKRCDSTNTLENPDIYPWIER
jgi:hypothetical protein